MNIVGLPALVGTYDNYIWIIHNTQHAWVIDPGESKQVIDFLEQHQLIAKAILVTHNHFDHIDGIADILTHFPEALVYGPEKAKLPAIQIRCKEGDTINFDNEFMLKVLDTPGHTKDHIAYYNDQALFCGDTLFTAGCGRILGGTVEQFTDSIIKLRELPDTTGFYCGHEYTQTNLTFSQLVEPDNIALQNRIKETNIVYPAKHLGPQSILGEEKETNPFLRFDTPELKAKLISRGADESPSSLFAHLRAWKDEFDKQH